MRDLSRVILGPFRTACMLQDTFSFQRDFEPSFLTRVFHVVAHFVARHIVQIHIINALACYPMATQHKRPTPPPNLCLLETVHEIEPCHAGRHSTDNTNRSSRGSWGCIPRPKVEAVCGCPLHRAHASLKPVARHAGQAAACNEQVSHTEQPTALGTYPGGA